MSMTFITDLHVSKKGCECRANLPMMMWPETSIAFDKNKTINCHFVDGKTSR